MWLAHAWVAEQVRQTRQPLDQCLPYGNPPTLADGIDYGMYSIPEILCQKKNVVCIIHNVSSG